VFSEAWEWSPLIMLVALGIIGSIKKEVYEAASVHGASAWQIFRRVTLPTLLRSPVMGFVIVIRFVDAMRAFEIPFSWASWVSYPGAGSPVDTLSLLLFKLLTGYTFGFPVGFVSAVAISMLVITLTGATVLFRLMNRRES
jgi:multiple sugar transport system permease protein